MAEEKTTEFVGTNYGPASAMELDMILEAAWKARQPMFIVGAPGVGKTARIKWWSKLHGFGEPIVLVGSHMEPPDVMGLPHAASQQRKKSGNEIREIQDRVNAGTMTEEEGIAATAEVLTIWFTDYLMPVWQMKLQDGQPHILFFDEFSNTPRMVQAALLKIIGEGVFANGTYIPDNCFIVGAMNPADTAVDYTPIAAAMVNRLLLVSYRPTWEEVVSGLKGEWFTEEEQAAWSENERKWRERITDFLREHSAYILKPNTLINTDYDTSAAAYLDPDSETDSSEREILTSTWASPRSWDNCCRVLANTAFAAEVTPIQERILAGMVGRESTAQLMTYVRAHTHIDAFELIRNPELQDWRVNSETDASFNDVMEIVNTIIAKIPECNGQNGAPTAEEALNFFIRVEELGGANVISPHFATGPARTYLTQARPSDITQREWMRRINMLLKKFAQADVLA